MTLMCSSCEKFKSKDCPNKVTEESCLTCDCFKAKDRVIKLTTATYDNRKCVYTKTLKKI